MRGFRNRKRNQGRTPASTKSPDLRLSAPESETEPARPLLGLFAGLNDLARPGAITAELAQEPALKAWLDESLEAALEITRAEMGSIQIVDDFGSLQLVAHRGFDPPLSQFLEARGKVCVACQKALKREQRVMVEDLTKSAIFAGTPDLDAMLKAGIRALQSTPLVTRSGHPVGILSTHFRAPTCPDERDFRLLDLLARQITDLLERAQAQAALRESERRWRDVIDHANAIVWLKDLDGRFLRINRCMEKELDVSASQVIGRTVFDLFPQPVAQQYAANDRRVIESGLPMEFEETVPESDGEHTYIAMKFPLRDAAGRPYALCGICTDVTKRKAAEARVQSSEAQLRTVVENLTQGVVVSDLDGQLLHWNRAALEMHGFASLEECRRQLYELADTFELSELDGTILPMTRWPLARILQGENLTDWEVAIRRVGSSREPDGRPLMAVVTVADITERKRAEQIVRQVQEDLSRAQAVAQTGSWRLDVHRDELTWSDETHRIFGIPPETHLTYQTFLAAIHPEDRERVDRSWQAALRGKPYDVEHRIVVNGRVKWIREKAELELDHEGSLRGGFGTCQDITRQRTIEEELRELTRTLEERVAARTAEAEQRAAQLLRLNQELSQVEQKERRQLAELLHDGLQQMLVAAKLRAADARERVPEDKPLRPVLDQLNRLLTESIEVSRSLTLQLSPPTLHERGLIPALEWLSEVMEEKYDLHVELKAADDAEPPTPDLRFLLFQAARELLFNVVKHAGTTSATVCLQRRDQLIILAVTDAGCGFEAKTAGDRLGFGLSNVQQRLQFSGGRLEVESAPHRGTKVTVIVPLPSADAAGPRRS
jgi:PAS domain S-box-containing protein